MDESNSRSSGERWLIVLGLVLIAIAGAAGYLVAGGKSDPAASLSSGDRQAIEAVVQNYILENPEIIPQAIENLQAKESASQLSSVRDQVEKPYPGAMLGNPDGNITLVEFTDFACGYCRRAVDDIDSLIAKHPQLRIVVRELPILSPESAAAARMALAAAEQGKYAAFYHAMFAAGRPGPQSIEAAARTAGLDMAKARSAARNPRIEAEISNNLALARQLGFDGTPSWIVGDQLISGAVGANRLAEAIAAAGS